MTVEQRYTIILEHSAEVLLEDASLTEVEAFWDAHDEDYFGLRMEDACGPQVRIIVTDEIPEEEEEFDLA